MNDELSYSEVLDKLPAYALGALEPAEMLAVDAYIQRHEQLLTRLHESEEAAVQLAYLAPTIPLPSGARDRLLQRVRAELQTGQVDGVEATPAAEVHPVAQAEAGQKSQPAATGGWLATLRTVFSPINGWAWTTGLALLVLLVAGFYVYQMLDQIQARLHLAEADRAALQADLAQLETTNGQIQEQLLAAQANLDQLQAELAQLEVQNGQIQERLGQAESDRDRLQAQVTQLQTDNETLKQANQSLVQQLQIEQSRLELVVNNTPILVPGTEEAPEALAVMYPGDNQALLIFHGLEPLPPEETYQLWLIPEGGSPVPAGLVSIQAQGPTSRLVEIPGEAQDFAAVGLSIEPAGGSPAPTGPIVLLGTVS